MWAAGVSQGLRWLSLNRLRLTCTTLKAIASGNLPELRELYFDDNHTVDETVRHVLTTDQLPKLRRLSVAYSKGMKNRPKLEREFGDRIKV